MKSWQTLLGLIMILLVLFVSENSGQEPMRQWSSRYKNETVEASFQSYDRRTKRVSLRLQNGESIHVDLKQLSRSDQRYVTGVARNNLDNAKTNKRKVVTGKEKNQPRSQRSDSTREVTAYGIQWTPGVENALKNAAGKESAADDRPVMWLRVLGDLDGFM
jgi:hypothetical protein